MILSRRLRLFQVVAFASFLGLCAVSLSGQHDGETFFESIDVDIVNVDVVVVDSNGRPVVGLAREDFELLEDGEPVEIVNFSSRNPYVDDALESRSDAPNDANEPDRLDTEASDPLHLIVYLDEENLRLQTRNRILESVRTFLRQGLQPGDKVMVVTDGGGLRVRLQPTSSVREMERVITDIATTTNVGSNRQLEFQNVLREIEEARLVDITGTLTADSAEAGGERSLAALRQYANVRSDQSQRSLARLKQLVNSVSALAGRKALLYVSEGLSLRPGEALLQAWENKFSVVGISPGLLSTAVEVLRWDSGAVLKELAEHASSQRVTFFALGGGGGTVSSMSPERAGLDSQALLVSGGGRVWTAALESLERSNRTDALLQVAHDTGGLASPGEGDVDGFLQRMRNDLEAMYSLGFQPAHRRDGKVHKLTVRVKGERFQVRHRREYRDKANDERLIDRTHSALLLDEVANPLGLSLEIGPIVPRESVPDAAAPVPGEEGTHVVPVTVKIPLAQLVLVPQQYHHVGQLSLFVAAQNDRGAESPMQRIEVPIRVPNERLLTVLSQAAGYRMDLAMRAGPHTVAVAVRDEIGSVESAVSARLVIGSEQ